MASGTLVRDKESNVKQAALRRVGNGMEYEFAFPYRNEDLGDSLWQLGRAYQIVVLVGPTEEFKGLTEDTWMSDQVYIRLESPSKESIYHPPYTARHKTENRHEHSHGGGNEQKN
jgi:hypothetical protein